jgi:N-ethylmaleimide reductase
MNIFASWSTGDLHFRNRIVMAPLTRARASDDGIPSPLAATYYAQRSAAGLIVAEATNISPQAIGFVNTPGIYTRDQIDGWKAVTDAVHANGSKIFLQLWHTGRVSLPMFHGGELPVAPSAVEFSVDIFTRDGVAQAVTPRALRTEEIPGIVDDYAQAAANAMKAGFDGVELHGASGMLPVQFLHANSNTRTDEYGGSLQRRARFMLDVLDACLTVTGAGRTAVRLFPYSTYLDSKDPDPVETYTYLLEQLGTRTLGYVHLIEGQTGPLALPEGEPSFLSMARERLKCALIVNGAYDRASADALIATGLVDAVAFGTPFIANPDLVERFAKDLPLNTADHAVFYGGGAEGYIDFPTYGQERNT